MRSFHDRCESEVKKLVDETTHAVSVNGIITSLGTMPSKGQCFQKLTQQKQEQWVAMQLAIS
jgi:hypothetical protein